MNQNLQDIEELLLLQYLQGNADDELRARIEEWLNAGSGNRNHLDRLESLWLETGRISPAPVAVDIDGAWNRMSKRLERDGEHAVKVRNIMVSRSFWAAAASVLLIAGIFSIFMLVRGPRQLQLSSLERVLVDTLPDGSRITLNRNSTLAYPDKFDDKSREVRLTGDAFFEVKHDSLQPFIIEAGAAKIMVLGTSFRVNTHPDGVVDPDGVVEVTVAQGRVMFFRINELSGDTISLVLRAGERGILKEGAILQVKDPGSPDQLFWANHSLDFRSTSLSEVFALLEKYYPVKIGVSDPNIMDCRLSGSFVNEPANRILVIIAESFGLKLEVRGQHYQLTGNGCSKEAK